MESVVVGVEPRASAVAVAADRVVAIVAAAVSAAAVGAAAGDAAAERTVTAVV
jgi:hypothetical protein